MSKLLFAVSLLGLFFIPCAFAASPVMQVGLVKSTSYSELKEVGFQPRKDIGPWKFSIPIAWDADPYNDTNWQFQLHAWRIIDPIFLEYNKQKDEALLKEALSIVVDWYDHHVTKGKSSSKQWYDMATGIRAMKLAWLWGEVNAAEYLLLQEDRSALLDLMSTHIDKLSDPSLLAEGNHAYFQLVGLRLLCSAEPSLVGCRDEATYGTHKMAELLDRQFTVQGIHRENSPGYHVFTLKLLKSLHVADLYGSEIEELIQKAEIASFWLVYPDRSIARVGDTGGKYDVQVKSDFNSVSLNGHDFLIGNYIDSGYFTVRTPLGVDVENSTQLFISGISNKEEAHKHADELSFELFHKGKLVLVDSGKYSYNDGKYRNYIVSANAHNTLSLTEIDTGPKDISKSGSKLKNFNISGHEVTINGEILRPGRFLHSRRFKFIPFEKLEIEDRFVKKVSYFDTLVSLFSDSIEITSNLHVNPEFDVEGVDENSVRIGDKLDITLNADNCKLNVVKGIQRPILGWVSFSYNDIVPAPVLQAKCAGSEGRLVWSIHLR